MQDPRYDGLEQRVRKLEQHTEPITIPRIELDPGGIQSRLDNQAELLKEVSQKQDELSKKYDEQEEQLTLIFTDAGHMKTDIGLLKGSVEVIKADVGTLKQDVSTLKSDVSTIKGSIIELRTDMQKRFDSIAEVQKLILDRLPAKE